MTTPEKNIPLLNASNYSAWSTQIEMILREKKVWKVVKGEETSPDPSDGKYTQETTSAAFGQGVSASTYQQDLEAYETKVDKANATIFANMTQTVVNEHKTHKDPAALWSTLESRYAPRTNASCMILFTNFVNATIKSDELVPDYLARLTSLKDRVVECGGTVDESMYKGLMF